MVRFMKFSGKVQIRVKLGAGSFVAIRGVLRDVFTKNRERGFSDPTPNSVCVYGGGGR